MARRPGRVALLALPAVVLIAVFMLLPTGIGCIESFRTANSYGGTQAPWTVSSYIRFFYDRDLDDAMVFDPTYLRIFVRSFALAGMTTLICLAVGLPIGWYGRHAHPLRKLLVLAVTIPFWTDLLVRIYCWEQFSSARDWPFGEDPENARLFLQFMLRPENAGLSANFTHYTTAISGAEAYCDQSMRDSPELKVPADLKMSFTPACRPSAIKLIDRVWTKLKR